MLPFPQPHGLGPARVDGQQLVAVGEGPGRRRPAPDAPDVLGGGQVRRFAGRLRREDRGALGGQLVVLQTLSEQGEG